MVTGFGQKLHSEFMKIRCTTVWLAVTLLVTAAQGVLAFLSAKQNLSVGLNATPETCPDLLEAMPPLAFMGFDVILFSTIPLIVLGAVIGASEYRQHCLRTTVLALGKKEQVFFAKTLALSLHALILSAVSVILTITVTHLTFGAQGLTPLVFTAEVWRYIAFSITALTLLTILAYVMGFLFRSAVFPLLFLIVQAYNVGDLLAEKFAVCRLLPVSLVNRLIASSESMLTGTPAQNILLLLLWVCLTGTAAYLLFRKRDLRGEY